jgi:ribosome recycling factor
LQKAVDFFRNQVKMVQSGQVSIGLIESIMVNVDGRNTPVSHLGYCQVVNNGLAVNLFDSTHTKLVSKTIQGFNFNCYEFSKEIVMVSRPMPTQEEKAKSVKYLKGLAEEAKNTVKKIRQTYRSSLDKTTLKDNDSMIQKAVDVANREIDGILNNKITSL